VVAQKAPGKKTIKTGGARGQGRSYTRSKLPISHMADDLAYVPEQFEAYADSLAESAGRSGSDQRPHHPHKTGGGGGGGYTAGAKYRESARSTSQSRPYF
jgi:hypothetical protein